MEWVYSSLGFDFRGVVNILDVLHYFDREGIKKDIQILDKDTVLCAKFQL